MPLYPTNTHQPGQRHFSPSLVQRAVILQLLAEEKGLDAVQLREELSDIPIEEIADALLILERNLVICREGSRLYASAPAKHLGRLDLLGV